VAWLVTGKLTFAVEIGVADTLIKLGAYYFHERLWIRVKFGKLRRPEYEI
jgi:adenylylsulfate kinase